MNRNTTPLLTLVFTLVFLALSPAGAQTVAPGRVTGRIFNPATGEFVRNAEIAVEGTNIALLAENRQVFRDPSDPSDQSSIPLL